MNEGNLFQHVKKKDTDILKKEWKEVEVPPPSLATC